MPLPACGGSGIGFANPDLYQVAAADPSAFYDITSGDNDLTGTNDGAYPALAGYDMATGLGTPNAAALPGLLCDHVVTDPVSVTDPGNQTSLLDAAVSLSIQATDATRGQSLTYSATGPAHRAFHQEHRRPDFGNGRRHRHLRGRGEGTGRRRVLGHRRLHLDSRRGHHQCRHATATVGQPFSFTVVTTGPPTSLTMKGKRPAGLSFGGQTGILSGTPKAKDTAGQVPAGDPGRVRQREEGHGGLSGLHPHPHRLRARR